MNEELEKYIYEIIEEFKPKLFLEKFSIELKKDDKISGMECSCRYPYLDIDIKYSPRIIEMFEKKELKTIKSYTVHELCHLITDPFYSKAINRYIGKNEIEDERELLTDTIAQIILKATV